MRLTPASSAARIDGAGEDGEGAYLKARVRALAENNEANRALEALIAGALGVAKSKVSVVRGHMARMKTLQIEDADDAAIAALMAHHGERT